MINADTLTVTHLDRAYLLKTLAFLRRFYGDKFYGAEERYFDWQYLQVPCDWYAPDAAHDKLPVNAILDDNDDIIAIHIFIPFDARTPWGGTRGVWDTEWVNGSGIRGAGRVLARHLLALSDVYAGFGMSDEADQAFRKLGLTIYDEIFRRVAVLDREALAARTAEAGHPREADALPGACTLPDRPWHTFEAAAGIPTPVLDHYAETTPFGASRTPEWMVWRYDRHPFITYTPVSADPDRQTGVAIARFENIVGTNLVNCRLTEFLPMPGYERALLEAVVAFARSKGALIVDYFTTSSTRADAFDATTGGSDFGVMANPRVPYMYQPLDFNQRNATNMVVVAGGDAPPNLDLRTFHATKGDTDQDLLRSPESAPAF